MMLGDLILWFLTVNEVVMSVLVSMLILSFFVGLFSFTKGVSRWT